MLAARLDFYKPDGTLRHSLTSHVRGIQIRETATDQADDAGFDVAHDFVDLSNFVVGDEVRVFVQLEGDGALNQIWDGIVDNVRSDRHGSAFADLPIKAQGYVYWTLAHTFITDSYSNMTATAIVKSILTVYVPSISGDNIGLGLYALAPNTDVVVPSISFNGESALSAIRRVAQFAGYTFHGDMNKNLYFYPRGTIASGQTATPTQVVRDTFSVETDFSDFGNVVTVIGGQNKVQDAVSAGGAFSSWATVTGIVRKHAQVFFSKSRVSRVAIWTNPSNPSALTGGLTVRIQANNSTGTAPQNETNAQFDLASKTLTASQLTAGGWTYFDLPAYTAAAGNNCWVIVESDSNSQRVGLDGGGNLMWQTYFDQPIVVQLKDNDSAATYGVRPLQPVTNTNIQTEDEAVALALRLLAEHKNPPQSGSYEVQDMAGLGVVSVGTTASMTFTADGVATNTPMIIVARSHDFSADRGTYVLRHEFVNAIREKSIGDVLRAYNDRLKRLEDAAAPQAILYVIAAVNEISVVAESVTATDTTRTAKVDAATVGFDLVV